MSEREYSKRNRKRRGVNESALEKFKRSRDSKTRGIDRVEVNVLSKKMPLNRYFMQQASILILSG